MTIEVLREWATEKTRFVSLNDYVNFASEFLAYRGRNGFQAELVARNTPQYRFFQFREDADYRLSRPINTNLFYGADEFDDAVRLFRESLTRITDEQPADDTHREALCRVIYTCQQSIGASLDALPANRSNTARKVNGDLFERLICLAIEQCGVHCRSGVLTIPVEDEAGNQLFGMKYQHDIMLEIEGDLKAIGSVKTSSKDRLDKVFIDKFLYNRLTGISTPHFAIFLHDVQRAGKEPDYRTSNTFLPGHFKGYTVKLNPLDGVYFCDLLPAMRTDPLLNQHISRVDQFFMNDLRAFVRQAPEVDIVITEEYEKGAAVVYAEKPSAS